MTKYKARFKGLPIKGMGKSDVPADDGEDVEEEPKKPKAKDDAATPEKKVVRDFLGIQDKKPAKGKKEVGEKGSSKSGNHGHAGIPGKRGGSAPKGGAVTSAGATPAVKDPNAGLGGVVASRGDTSGRVAGVGGALGSRGSYLDKNGNPKPAAQQAIPTKTDSDSKVGQILARQNTGPRSSFMPMRGTDAAAKRIQENMDRISELQDQITRFKKQSGSTTDFYKTNRDRMRQEIAMLKRENANLED